MKKFFAILSITLGFCMALLDTTIVNITLPKMTQYYGTDVKTISWVLNGYNLAFAVLLITASRLADQFGRKKIYLIGVTLFTLASLMSGLSTSVSMLITFRVIQGLAAAFVVPVTMPMSIQMVSEQKRGALMGFWGAFAGLSAASGPALGGVLSQNFNWQSIFYINLPLGAVAFLLCAALVKESYDPTATRKIDWWGMLTLSITMFCTTLALIQANDKGWGSTYIISLLALALASIVAFIVIENRVKEPLVPLWLMKIVPFAAGNLSLFMIGLGLMSGVFLLTFYLTNVLGLSELRAGLVITALPLTSMVCSAISGNLSQKLGNRWFTLIGMTALAVSIYLFGELTPTSSRFDIIWRLMIGGLGLGFSMAPLLDATMRSVPDDKAGMASGISNMARTLGQVLGAAILITLLTSNLNQEISSAKGQVVSLVRADNVLSTQAKDKLTSKLQSTTSSPSNKAPKLNAILAQVEAQKAQALKQAPAKVEASVSNQFAAQEQATRILFGQIQQLFVRHTPNAGQNAIALVQGNKVLTSQTKARLVQMLSSSRGAGPMPSADSTIAGMEQQKPAVIASAKQKATATIRATFAKQEAEISKLYPTIQSTFTNSVSNAFSKTFQLSSLLMLCGLLFGAFSDPRKRGARQGKDSNRETVIVH